MTKKLYLDNTYRYHCEAQIITMNTDERGPYVILDQTIFYPQGGGQPSDQGTIGDMQVLTVREVHNEIRHYVDKHDSCSKAECHIDPERRTIHAGYHTAGHLISAVMESLFPGTASLKGHHFPGEAYVEFAIKDSWQEAMTTQFEQALAEAIASDEKVKVQHQLAANITQDFPYIANFSQPDEQVRMMQIGDFKAVPCGGTHVEHLGEIRNLRIEGYRLKNGCLRVRYAC